MSKAPQVILEEKRYRELLAKEMIVDGEERIVFLSTADQYTEYCVIAKDDEAMAKVREEVKSLLDDYYTSSFFKGVEKVEPRQTWLAKLFDL
jgi:hypothetical protein